MRNFYFLLIVFSGAYLAAQAIGWIFFGKIFFPDAGELFVNSKEKSLMQTVFPKDMLRLIIVIFAGSVAGILMDTAGLDGWVSLPLSAMAGITVNFIFSTVVEPIYNKYRKSGEPSDEELEGLSAVVIEDIDDELFGVIEVRHGVRSYLMRAVTANGRYIPKGKKVVVIYAQEGCCFVESEEHLYDILFEEE